MQDLTFENMVVVSGALAQMHFLQEDMTHNHRLSAVLEVVSVK